MKKFLSLLAAVGCLFVTSCSEDSPEPPHFPSVSCSGYYVINQGNYYDNITGTLSFGDFTEFFPELQLGNGTLGDTPENGVIVGHHLYVPCNASSSLTIIDMDTHSIVGRIQLNFPQYACTDGTYIYVTESDGQLARISAATQEIVRTYVGPSPYACLYSAGRVYVNCAPWTPDYSAPLGRSVAVVDTKSYTKVEDIEVGLNPYDQMGVDASGCIYTVCSGNFADIQPEVWQISSDGKAKKYADGSIIATSPLLNVLYVIKTESDYSNYPEVSTKSSYSIIDTRTGKAQDIALQGESQPAAPIAAFINPENGHLFVTSDGAASAYSSLGTLHEYSSRNELLHTYQTGVHPYYVVFRPETK
ncbi:MAG: hypothetical protein MJZ40_00125 [Bacteroidaceae bacterium]|nr:hypothetical protein [Bacteroidaceae bacterium]